MASLYGKHWLDMWANIPIDEVKADWEAVLKRNNLTLKTCFMAMDKLADDGVQFPPTQPEFVRLCKSLLPREYHLALPSKRDQELAQASVEKINQLVTDVGRFKGRNWIAYWENILSERDKYRDCTTRAAEQALINLGKPWKGVEA
jgi:hypothetical protein